MSVDALVFWLLVGAWVVVAGMLLFGVLPRVVREASRIVRRLIALASDSELPLKIAKAEGDIERLNRAFDRFPPLVARVQAAVVVIRTTPIVPPALVSLAARIGLEVRAFRAERP